MTRSQVEECLLYEVRRPPQALRDHAHVLLLIASVLHQEAVLQAQVSHWLRLYRHRVLALEAEACAGEGSWWGRKQRSLLEAHCCKVSLCLHVQVRPATVAGDCNTDP